MSYSFGLKFTIAMLNMTKALCVEMPEMTRLRIKYQKARALQDKLFDERMALEEMRERLEEVDPREEVEAEEKARRLLAEECQAAASARLLAKETDECALERIALSVVDQVGIGPDLRHVLEKRMKKKVKNAPLARDGSVINEVGIQPDLRHVLEKRMKVKNATLARGGSHPQRLPVDGQIPQEA